MLLLPKITKNDNLILSMIAVANGNSDAEYTPIPGVVICGHFSYDIILENNGYEIEEYPEIDDPDFSPYGVCDNYEQVLDRWPEIASSMGRKFVVALTPVERSKQPEDGGWRWHKWGEYIGDQKPTCEYLHDEPLIEKVYCYHIYEIKE